MTAPSSVPEVGSPPARIGDLVEDLDTPLILADLDRMERNLHDRQSWMDERGVALRVHGKTHKVPEIALLQMGAGARGICCAKVSEAEPFAAVGIDDICIAYPVFGEQKWARAAALAQRGVRMTLNCDGEASVRQASEAAAARRVVLNLQIDVDSGMHRGGIEMDDVDRIERLARTIGDLPGVEFDGLTSRWGDGGLTIDGGSKTFPGDRGVVAAGDIQGTPRAMAYSTDRRVVIERLSEEHGMGRAEGDVGLGEKLRFYPFHACTCCNLTNEIIGVRGDRVETVWRVAARGLRT